MLNQVAVEALYSATYVENYLDSVENLPDDAQKHLSRIREIDCSFIGILKDVELLYEQWSNCPTSELEVTNNISTKRARAMGRLQQSLLRMNELGDEKLHTMQQLQDLIDLKTRQLDLDFKNLDYGKEETYSDLQKEIRTISPPTVSPNMPGGVVQQQVIQVVPSLVSAATTAATSSANTSANSNNIGYVNNNNNNTNNSERSSKRARRTRTDTNNGMDIDNIENNSKLETQMKQTIQSQTAASTQKKSSASANKKKKRKTGRQTNNQTNARETRDDTPPPEETIDPDEPTYCLCDQISFGEMILCDNDLCPIEWFHFSCVALITKPKGKWFCPNCRGDRPNVMKPKAQFLKELERYNREKEEKT